MAVTRIQIPEEASIGEYRANNQADRQHQIRRPSHHQSEGQRQQASRHTTGDLGAGKLCHCRRRL